MSPPAVSVAPHGNGAAEPPEPSTPPPARLKCVSVNAWHESFTGPRDGYARLSGPLDDAGKRELAAWRRKKAQIWIELALPDDPLQWFEGISDPWVSLRAPAIEWSDVEDVLAILEILPQPIGEVDHQSETSCRLLALLPHLYAMGVARIRREVFHGNDLRQSQRDGPLFFPTVGFEPAASQAASRNGASANPPGRLDGFWTIRTCVGVIGDRTVVTVRLPDLLCTGTPESEPSYRSPLERDLPIPRRFLVGRFPRLSSGPQAADIAEGIGLHHAATARAVAEKARRALRDIERHAGYIVVDGGKPAENSASRADPLRELERVSEITQQIDRQLSRELRRLTDYGDDQHPVAKQVQVRFGFALDEIRSLGTELSTARSAIVSHIQVQEQNERERFQFIVALLGAAILIPTLVAAIYGANVNVPGENSWTGFRALLLFIVSFFIFGVLAVNQLWAKGWAPRRNWLENPWLKAAALGIATVCLALAIVAAVP